MADSARIPADLEGRRRVVIDRVAPNVDGGAFPVKRVVGDTIVVEAVAYADGHDALACVLLHRRESDPEWVETRMEPLVNDRWRACFTTAEIGRYRYTVMAWIDRFATWAHDLEKRVAARQDLATDLVIGALLVEEAASPRDRHGRRASSGARVVHPGRRRGGDDRRPFDRACRPDGAPRRTPVRRRRSSQS